MKRIIVIIAVAILACMTGCLQKQPEAQNQPPEFDEPGMTITESDLFDGFKKLNAAVALNEPTDHGSTPLENETLVCYSLHFPEDWTLEGSVFYNGKNEKIAELPPAVYIDSPESESAYLDYKPVEDIETLIEKGEIKNSQYKATRAVIAVDTEAGRWYPHIYRLSNGKAGFSINFYSAETGQNQELFDKIIGTFKFEG